MESDENRDEKVRQFRREKSERFDAKSMSIVLDEDSIKTFKKIIATCKEHLGNLYRKYYTKETMERRRSILKFEIGRYFSTKRETKST